ncbi:MAG: histidine ammonia-lyase [Bacteroidota bacterium]
METYEITNQLLFDDIIAIIKLKKQLKLSTVVKKKITTCRDYLDKKMSGNDVVIYGINTGFGSLCNTKISNEDLEKLQQNLLLSHACGTGEKVNREIVKLMLLLKIQSLSYGNSGVQLQTVERLVEFFNFDILPVVYDQGSLGASGDLAPLAHLCLPLLGLGEVWSNSNGQWAIISGAEALQKHNLHPIKLQSKEGLALINGTQFMAAYGVACLLYAQRLSLWADKISSISIDAFDCRTEPFHPALHLIRHHKGQVQTAQEILACLQDSQISKQKKEQVQDPYSFRCIPQVHGASKDAMDYVTNVFTTEINSVTDNPNIFPDLDLIISGGNFHGQTLALSLDFLAIACAELGNISERRTFQLISGQRGLPAFLVSNPGLNSGLMIPQYTAASIVSQNKQLCSPASVDSIVSSNGQEDHVSMGANAATKCLRVINNLEKILAIELLNASQALEFRRPLKTSPYLEGFIADYRKVVPFISEDRALYIDIENSISFLRTENLIKEA